jgi:hypothetical protein
VGAEEAVDCGQQSDKEEADGDLAAFTHQDVVGTAGGRQIHHFEPLLRASQRSQKVRGREAQAVAGAEQDDLGIECGEPTSKSATLSVSKVAFVQFGSRRSGSTARLQL